MPGKSRTSKSPRKSAQAPAIEIAPEPAADGDVFRVVGIGASAGGLQACKNLIEGADATCGMAFIFVQHLDPSHASMIPALLGRGSGLKVAEAVHGTPIEPGSLYIIPPGQYIGVRQGLIDLSVPDAVHGNRMPVDFLFQSLASELGARACAVILSGNGSDGSIGLTDIHAAGGLVVAQTPEEAEYPGMPSNAIATELCNAVLPAKDIFAYLASAPQSEPPGNGLTSPFDASGLALKKVVEVLKERTGGDFSMYKPGTLQRRISRRMALASIMTADLPRYLKLLEEDPLEADNLASDLLINVTSFFRDPSVFAHVSEKELPGLLAAHPGEQPFRIWVAGCSTGEEAYSLAMVLHEAIRASGRNIVLQMFGSDRDEDAIKVARDGQYPAAIEGDVSALRLQTFFNKNELGYRVKPELRESIVFTVQDILSDPPFSRLNLISCRNLLIYLSIEAQAKLAALFHFALREDGLLLLGRSETVAQSDGRFEAKSKANRLFRRIGRSRPGDLGFLLESGSEGRRKPGRQESYRTSRQTALSEQCRRAVLEAYGPASVLITSGYECLFSFGKVDRYLQIASGAPSHNLLEMAAGALRTKLRSAIQKSLRDDQLVSTVVSRAADDKRGGAYKIEVRPLDSAGERLALLSFVDEREPPQLPGRLALKGDRANAALELELEMTRNELRDALRDLEMSGEEQKAINEEALSANEEYQSSNEELVTSKEELQSLNEELTALNGQLQETLEKQRTTSDDLQNVLYSTDVATIFLDADLNIRFFTPATRLLFSVIAADIGRPLKDLHSLASDSMLWADAKAVLRDPIPIEREIETHDGTWFNRKILPYRTHTERVEGVVITFTDITERKRVAKVLGQAKRQAELATVAKSQFLAAASHDLRQPLQTLTLVQELLRRAVTEEGPRKLIDRLDQTLGTMSSMLNTLLDINQIEAGTVHPQFVAFPINDVLHLLSEEFSYHAEGQRLELHVVPSRVIVYSDPRLLEQMLRNLLANALKYTKSGKVLVGCRRKDRLLSVQIWDTGIGIEANDLETIFEEYRQLENPGQARGHGLGLGLSIVKRLGELMEHPIEVRSVPGRGSGFLISVPLPSNTALLKPTVTEVSEIKPAVHLNGSILIIEDEHEVAELLEQILVREGHQTTCAYSGEAAIEMVRKGKVTPDIVLADFDLPKGMDGLRTSLKLRRMISAALPVVIFTGDISASTLHEVDRAGCVALNKPVKAVEMARVIQTLLTQTKGKMPVRLPRTEPRFQGPVIYVVDDDSHVRESIRDLLEADGRLVEDFATCRAFLDTYRPGTEGCLLIDAYLPDMTGLELLEHLREAGHSLPSIMITGNSDVPMAVHAMKAGASNFIEKPIGQGELLDGVRQALEESRDSRKVMEWRQAASEKMASLTERQREIMTMVLAGQASKNIASELKISQRTVENHRASIMQKTGAKSLPALARLALAATWTNEADQAVADPVVQKRPRTVIPRS